MADILLRELQGDSIVVQFGGDFRGINAYTFANSLIGFADIVRAVSDTIDPGQEIEILVEEHRPGSFRACVRRVCKGYGGIISGAAHAVFWGVVTNVIYDAAFQNDPKPPVIIISSDEVIIEHGSERIIVPRNVYNQSENAKKNPALKRSIEKTFKPLDADEKVKAFGLTTHIDRTGLLISIPRDKFPRMVTQEYAIEIRPGERVLTKKAKLLILKAWINSAKRKWSFEWNGVLLSAPISDEVFQKALASRVHLIGNGDALDTELTFKQYFDEAIGIYVTDPQSYVVTRVIRHISREQIQGIVR